MKKTKWLAVLLCAIFVLQSVPAANASFTDISDAETARAAPTLAGLGIIDSASSFRPNDSLTRAEACKMVIGAMGLRAKVSAYEKKTLFSDVKPSMWYTGYVNLAYSQGIISGLGNGTFGPNDTLSYGQLATMLLRMLGYTSAETGSVWPVDQINFCESLGVSSGLGLNGNQTLTRAQAAVMICRALKTDKNGTGKPYYTAMDGVASTGDAILMDTNASTGGASGLVTAYLLEGSTGAAYYTQANPQSAELCGCAGTLLFDAAGRVTGFIPNSTETLDLKLASADASTITGADGKSYRVASGAKLIVGGESYPYASTGYLQLNDQTGSSIRLYFDDNGAIAYLYLAGGILNSANAAVAATTSAASSLARQLGIASSGCAITKNGAAASASDVAKDDVGYYDALSNTLRVSDYRVFGYISAASPNISAAQTVTVGGHTFDVLECAWDTLKNFKVGEPAALLLTDDGKVAAAQSSSSGASMLGILAANGKSVTLLGSGVTLSAGKMEYNDGAAGSLVTVTVAASDTIYCSTVSGSGAGELDLEARTLGKLSLAPSCAVFEWGGSDYVYSLEGVQGQASYDFDAIDWTTTVPASCVSYAHKNTAGEVDVLVLKDVTGNCYTYGRFSLYADKDGINLGNGSMEAYNTAASIRNSGGASSKYLCLVSAAGGCYAGVTLGTHTISGYTKVSDFKKMFCFETAPDSFFVQDGRLYAVSGSVEYPVSDQVEIYFSGTDTWISGTDALITLLSGDYTFEAYYDAVPSAGGRIRVIVVS
ncbi:MAG: S-layer homology domain-containing protein [Ruminococcaceae bacterium]|nr:S-layer homology domain-containing protein [Oscillospiraceae bacterium]